MIILATIAWAVRADDDEYNNYDGPSEEDVVELDATNFD